MKIKQISLFEIADLQKPENASLKALAIEKNRYINVDSAWWTYTHDDFKEICSRIGIDVEEIYFSGFGSQGDGACFLGCYRYKKQGIKLLMEYIEDKDIIEIAGRMKDLQKSCFYKYAANIEQHGRYCHEHSMYTNSEILEYKGFEELDRAFLGCFRDLAKWLYKRLEKEYYFLTSDSDVFETLQANKYTFNEFGEIDS